MGLGNGVGGRRGTIALVVAAIVTTEAFWAAGWVAAHALIVNRTNSIAPGLYLRRRLPGRLERGSVVIFCPEPAVIARLVHVGDSLVPGGADACADGSAPFLKRVVAVPGERVDVATSGAIRVDGVLLPRSAPLASRRYRSLRVVAPGRYRVATGTVWVISDSSHGYDSRYYGAIRPAALATPLVIWGKADP